MPAKRLIDATPSEREDRIHAICSAAATDTERQALYWQFCVAEMQELNALAAARGLPLMKIPEWPPTD